jgi:predicted DNA-binding protein (MmcQ/YjbR family)
LITVAAFRKLALSLPDATEAPHFDSDAFLVRKKIFATLNESTGRAVVKLQPEQQEVMTAADPAIFERVPNYWGNKGWTILHLKRTDKKAAESALRAAWKNMTAPKAAPKRRPAANKGKAR